MFYADENISDIEKYMSIDLASISRWCDYNQLVVNIDKTKAMLLCTKQKREAMGKP